MQVQSYFGFTRGTQTIYAWYTNLGLLGESPVFYPSIHQPPTYAGFLTRVLSTAPASMRAFFIS